MLFIPFTLFIRCYHFVFFTVGCSELLKSIPCLIFLIFCFWRFIWPDSQLYTLWKPLQCQFIVGSYQFCRLDMWRFFRVRRLPRIYCLDCLGILFRTNWILSLRFSKYRYSYFTALCNINFITCNLARELIIKYENYDNSLNLPPINI